MRILCCILLALCLFDVAAGQQLVFRKFTRASGLASEYIFCIFQDRDGFLWFGTDKGVSRFDGVEFKTLTTSDGLPSNLIYSIYQDGEGAFWFATFEGGVARWDGLSVRVFTHAEGLYGNDVRGVTQDRYGRMYFLTTVGLSVLHNGVMVRGPAVRLTNAPLKTLRDGTVIFGGDSSLFVVHPTNDTLLDVKPLRFKKYSIGQYMFRTRALEELEDGSLLFPYHKGILRFRLTPGGIPTNERLDYAKPLSMVTGLHRDNDGTIWASTEYGLLRLRNGRITRYSLKEGIDPPYIESLLSDNESNLWLGTFGGGALRLTGTYVTRYPPASAGDAPSIAALFEDSKGRIWLGHNNGYSIVYPDGSYRSFPPSSPGSSEFRAFSESPRRILYAGTFTHLLSSPIARADAGRFTFVKEFPSGVSSLRADSKGVWIGTYGLGATRLEGNDSVGLNTTTGLSSDMVEAIVRGPGSVWFLSFNKGATRYAGDTLKVYSAQNGLPSNAIYSLLEENDGTMWFGTDRGLTRVRGNTVRTFDAQSGLRGIPVVGIFRSSAFSGSKQGKLYVITNNAIHVFKDDTLVSYGSTPILPYGEVSINRIIYNDAKNIIWLGTTEGAVRLDVNEMEQTREQRTRVLPPVHITAILADTTELYAYDPVHHAAVPARRTFGPNRNNITIRYSAPSYGNERFVRYRIKLEPADANWSEPIRNREVVYRNLSEGEYTFSVVGISADGSSSATPATFSFVIEPPFYKRTLFVFLMGFILAAAIAFILRLVALRRLNAKVADLRRQRELMIEREQTRARIARDLHDDIASSLGSIGLYAESLKQHVATRKKENRDLLNRIAELSLGAIESMDDIIWSVAPQNDTLKSLLARLTRHSDEVLSMNGIRFRYERPDTLPELHLHDVLRRNIYLIFKEATNNIVKHSGATEATLTLECLPAGCALAINDNGKGFAVPDGGAPVKDDRNGLGNMHSRAREIGARLTIRSVPDAGTTVRMEYPYPNPKEKQR